jgi:hypothetical protein
MMVQESRCNRWHTQHSYVSLENRIQHYDVYIGNNSERLTIGYSPALSTRRIHNIGLPQSRIFEPYVADGGTTVCAEYLTGDLNRDCYIDFKDFAMVAENGSNAPTLQTADVIN